MSYIYRVYPFDDIANEIVNLKAGKMLCYNRCDDIYKVYHRYEFEYVVEDEIIG